MAEVESTIKTLQDHRLHSTERFNKIFRQIADTITPLQLKLEGPRVCGSSSYRHNPSVTSVEDYYRISLYIPFLDSVISNLQHRFSEKSKCVALFDILLPNSCFSQGIQLEKFEKLLNYFSHTLVSNGLSYTSNQCIHQYERWVRKWQVDFSQQNSPSTIVGALISCDDEMYPIISALLEIGTVLPVSTATVERTFSTLRVLKTYLRSTTSEDRLNGLAFMYIYSLMKINIDSIIKRFASSKNRRSILL